MSRSYQLIITLVLTTTLAACGDSSSDGNARVTASEKLSDSARFDRDFRKKGCEILTAELAGATFGIPAADLKQTKVMGCIYTWRSDTEKMEAHLSMIRAHKSEVNAAQWFANATKNKTAEEMKAEMEKVAERVSKNEALDTAAKKSAAKGILSMVGSKAITFEDVAAVGDEARASDDGTITVRLDNLTFNVSAYKGDRAPPLDLKGVELKEMAKITKKHDAQWIEKTAPQRKMDGTKLAKAIVAEL